MIRILRPSHHAGAVTEPCNLPTSPMICSTRVAKIHLGNDRPSHALAARFCQPSLNRSSIRDPRKAAPNATNCNTAGLALANSIGEATLGIHALDSATTTTWSPSPALQTRLLCIDLETVCLSEGADGVESLLRRTITRGVLLARELATLKRWNVELGLATRAPPGL
jgi:hypothetical protein